MRELPEIARRQCGVFSAAQAASSGWTPSALRHAVRTGRITRLRRGQFAMTDLSRLDPFTRARWQHTAPAVAAVLATPGAHVSHSAAAVLRGLPLAFLPDRPCVHVVPWHTGEIDQVHVHRARSEPSLVLPVAAVECTSLERTVIDMAREHGRAAGVVPLDFALRHGHTDPDRLVQALTRCRRWPGIVAARRALAAADPRSESPLESLSRLKIADFGLPVPQLQTEIGDEHGRFVGRVDFYWDEFGVVGEADGRQKYDDDDAPTLLEEKRRQELLEATELIVVRWGSADLRAFDPVAERLRRAFARGRRRPIADRRWTVLRQPPPPTLPL